MNSHKIKIEVQAILIDKDGKVVRRYPWKRANSLLKQFVQILAAQFSQTGQTIKDTGGENRAGGAHAYNLACDATTLTTYGIVIGTGNTPVTMTDIKLEAQATANIAHQTVTFAVENPNGATWRVAISRGFLNNTGATLSVKEVGLYVYFTMNSFIICADRTLYAVNVPSGITLTMTYRITISL